MRRDHRRSARSTQGRKDLDNATDRLAAIVGPVRSKDEQKRQTWRFAGMGLAAGILLWSVLPGTIARAMPESWQGPERMARKALGEPTIVETGIRLIRSQNPEAWEELAPAQRILSANRETIDQCKERARKLQGRVSCTIQVSLLKRASSPFLVGQLVKPALHHGATGWGWRNVTRLKQTGGNARGQNLIAWTKKTPIPIGNGGPEVEVGTAKCDASLRVAWLQVLLHSAAWLFLDKNRFWILDFGERAFDKSASLFAFDDDVDRPSAQLVIWLVHE